MTVKLTEKGAEIHKLAPKTITIHITEEDIKNGTRDNVTSCPVALAFKRRLPEFKVRATTYAVYLYEVDEFDKWDTFYEAPQEVTDFMRSFDKGEKVYPFDVTLTRGTV